MSTFIIVALILLFGALAFFMRDKWNNPPFQLIAIIYLSAAAGYFLANSISDEVYRTAHLFAMALCIVLLTIRVKKQISHSTPGMVN